MRGEHDAATEWEHDTFQGIIESKLSDGAPISKIELKNLFCEAPVINELMDLLVSQVFPKKGLS